jgi:hypothetical protein
MKVSDLTCPSCHAFYEVAESTSAEGCPGCVQCVVCGRLLASWQKPKLMACRLVLPPRHKYPRVSLPPPSSARKRSQAGTIRAELRTIPPQEMIV